VRVAAIAGALAVGLCSTASASAAVRYAAPNGTANPTTCASPSSPCDIVTAINGVTGNKPAEHDEVIVEPGSYGSAAAPLTTSLAPSVDLNIHGVAGQPRPVITTTAGYGLQLNIGSSASATDLDIEQPTNGTAFYLSNGTASQIIAHSTGLSGCELVGATLTDSVCWSSANGIGDGLYLPSSNSGTLTDTLRNVDTYGIVSAVPGIAMNASGTGTVDLLATNVIARGGGGGAAGDDIVSMGPGTADATLTDSDYATIHEGAGGAITPPGSVSDTEANPALVNPAGGDFHETAASPTIDVGISNAANGSFDFDGQPRETAAGKTDIGADEFFAVPGVTAGAVSGLSSTGATLNGSVTPGIRAAATYVFEYGTTPAGAVPVSASLAGRLAPGTLYYWKLVASNVQGTAATSAQTLMTPPSPLKPTGPAPSLTKVSVSPSKFFDSGRRHKLGTTITYVDSQAATTTFVVEQSRPGIRSGKRCVAPPRHLRGRPKHCTRVVVLGTFTHADIAGTNRVKFSGKLHGHALKPGRYELRIVARNKLGLGSTAHTTPFRVLG
jgi:hypothetical protein